MTLSNCRALILPAIVGTVAFFTGISVPDTAADKPAPQEAPKSTVYHQYLNVLVGDWLTTTRLAGPGGKPIESTGKARIRPLLGGRFILEEREGKVLGNDASSVSLYGYNINSKRFEAAMAYAGSSALTTLTGTSTDGRTLKLSGISTGKTGAVATEMSLRLENPSSFTITVGQKSGGGPVVTIIYKRAPQTPKKSGKTSGAAKKK